MSVVGYSVIPEESVLKKFYCKKYEKNTCGNSTAYLLRSAYMCHKHERKKGKNNCYIVSSF